MVNSDACLRPTTQAAARVVDDTTAASAADVGHWLAAIGLPQHQLRFVEVSLEQFSAV
jgi:hypothetical protein